MALVMVVSGCKNNPSSKKSEKPAFAFADDSDFELLEAPDPGDWRAVFNEPGQTFDEYVKTDPVKAEGARRVLVFQPVGPMSEKERDIFLKAVELSKIWFELPARVEPELPLPEKGWHRINQFPWQEEPQVQYQTTYFLNKLLPERMPPDAACFMAVTMADLYPAESWNYVFGQASFKRRVGVYSFVRYFPEFWGDPETEESDAIALRRAGKVLLHETCHMFGIAHCKKYYCLMNGSNTLEEGDGRPIRLCPECLRKLHYNRGFDVKNRYQNIERFFRDVGFIEDADWIAARAKKISDQ